MKIAPILEMQRQTQTSAPVVGEPVAIRTPADVAAGRVVADADAEIVVPELGALVDVLAGAIVRAQPIAVAAAALVASPRVPAILLTESRAVPALVNVLTAQTARVLLEARLAVTAVGARGVDTATAHAADALGAPALVDVHTATVAPDVVACRGYLRFG